MHIFLVVLIVAGSIIFLFGFCWAFIENVDYNQEWTLGYEKEQMLSYHIIFAFLVAPFWLILLAIRLRKHRKLLGYHRDFGHQCS